MGTFDQELASTFSRIAIIGSSGFIGRHLESKLRDLRLDFIAPKRSDYSDAEPDVEKKICLEVAKYRPDLIINLATHFTRTETTEDIGKLIHSNILLTGYLASIATEVNAIYLQTQSAWQFSEGRARNAPTLYFLYKQLAEDICDWYSEKRGLNSGILYLFDTYGPSDDRDKLIPQLLKAIKNGSDLDCTNGEQLIELVEISDVINAIFATATHCSSKSSQVSKFWCISPHPTTLLEIHNIVTEKLKLPLKLKWGKIPYRQGEIFERWQIQMPTPPLWTQKVQLESGLRNTWIKFIE